ncbi:hypothetical protein HZB60_05435 [candidate division KSB1 bacterium]|nr:hypothetical protein [candidate division KSB1 bacterium]
MRLAVALVVLLTAALAFSQDSGESEFEIQGSNILKYDQGEEVDFSRPNDKHPDNLLKRRFVENRLRLDVYRGNLRGGMRFLYFRPSDNDRNQYGLPEETRIDKRFIEAALHPVTLRVGHYGDLWANGLAFSSFENRDLYFDSELDGVRAQIEAGPLTAIGLRGSSADGLLVKRADASGGRLQWRGGLAGLGFSYVRVDSGFYAETNVSGLDLKFNRGVFTLNLERAWSETFVASGSGEGHATYVGVVLSKWSWSLLADYKDYDYGYVTPFQNPPTVYRELGPRLLQGREPHVMNIPNEVGYQLELSGQTTGTTFATLHYHAASRHAHDQSGIPRPTLQQVDAPFWECFANVEQSLPRDRSLFVELGANEEASGTWQQRKWVQTRFSTPLRAIQLDLEIEELFLTDKTRNDEDFLDQFYSAGLTWKNGFSVSGVYQLSNDRELQDKEGPSWPSVETALSFGENDRHRAILFYGRERGGLKCSNGVCRQVQAFSGFRLTLETSL